MSTNDTPGAKSSLPTEAQTAEINRAMQDAYEAKGRGEDPMPYYDKAEALMRKYGVNDGPGLGDPEEDGAGTARTPDTTPSPTPPEPA